MKSYRSRANAPSRPFKLKHIILAAMCIALCAGVNIFGRAGVAPQAMNAVDPAAHAGLNQNIWHVRSASDARFGSFSQTGSAYDIFNPASWQAFDGPVAAPDLEVSKTDGISQVNAGQTTVYTISITNNGAAAIVGANLTDTPVAGITVTSVSCTPAIPGNKCVTDPNLSDLMGTGVPLPTLSTHDTYVVNVTAVVSQSAGNSVTNTAFVALANNQGGNGAIDTDSVIHTADLTVSKTDGRLDYTPGGPITYTMVVRNLGPSDATGVSVTDTVPANITGVTTSCVSTGTATCGTNNAPAGNNVSFTNVNIAAGAVNFITITVTGVVNKLATGQMTNSVHVTPGTQTDPNLDNNDASDMDVVHSIADLVVTKTDNSATYTPGAGITYTIVVSNIGPSNASGVSVTDTVPTSITGVTTTCVASGGASCGTNNNPTGNNISFTNVAIPSDPTNFLTITVSGTVAPSTTGSLINSVHVTPGGQDDPNLFNNDATDTDTPSIVNAFVVTKDDGVTRVDSGGTTMYTVTFTNNGPSPADGATIRDAAAAGMTKTAIGPCSATGGAVCPTAGQLTIANLEAGTVSVPTWPVGGKITFTITVNVTATSGTMTNTASVTSPPGTLNPVTVSASDTDDVVQRDFSDAPASYGTPSHVISTATLRIGALVDAELGAFPTTNAQGDDTNNLNDEDGISEPLPTFTASNPQTYSVTVNNLQNTTGGPATLYAWVDLNKDGAFSPGEVQTATVANNTNNGSATLTWTNATFAVPASQPTYLRLRLTTTALIDNVGTGVDERATLEAANGEVEDYLVPAEPRGQLLICKQVAANDQLAVGTPFSFTSASFSGTIQVLAGANGSPNCSVPISVPSGPVTVTETSVADTAVTAITANPVGSLVSTDLPGRTGTVTVATDPAGPTSIIFTNKSTLVNTGIIEICKQLAAGDPLAVGTPFTFNVTGAVVPGPITINAGAFGSPTCSAPIEVTAGNQTITEVAVANTAVAAIVVNPASRLVTSSLTARSVTVAVARGDVTNQTVITYTNQTTRTGVIEICKDAADTDVTGSFNFTVEGAPGQIFSVPVGFCSNPITVTVPQVGPALFTARVTELARPNYRLVGVTTLPAGALNGPFIPDAGFDANGAPLANNTNGGYATVNLAVGGASTMKVVRFTNQSLPGQIKVCKITADPNIPLNTTFNFTVTGTGPSSATDLTPVPVSTTVQVNAGTGGGFCQFVPGTFIVGTNVMVTETAVLTPLAPGYTFADVRVSRITGLPGLVSSDLVGKTATLTARNTTAEIAFTNFTFRPAILKVCKTGGPGVTGTASFTMSLPNPLTSYAVSPTPITVPVGSCTFAQGPFPAIAAFPGIGTFNYNTQLALTEAAMGTTVITSVTSPTGGATSLTGRVGTITLNQQAGTVINEVTFLNSNVVGPAPARFDFDGDGKSDMAIYRSGTWWYAASNSGNTPTSVQFGVAGDKLVAADYDGDGKTDIAVYRNGTWYVLGSTSGLMQINFGVATDIPQPGDYDGDGKADFVVFRPADGNWYMQLSTEGFRAVHFGISTDKPVAADFDGDHKMDAAVYRDGTWYILGSTAGFYGVQFGVATDIPVKADYDGDGKADVAVYRSGVWYILGSSAGFKSVNYGAATDIPVPADYDGDAKTDIAVYRPSVTQWFILNSGLSQAPPFSFGSEGELLNY
jgi:uncharacterized repeat protein (TIGR01451 family)